MQVENLFTPDCIRTVTGQYVNVFDPDPQTILIEDIAHSLAYQCRFGGHLPSFFSVAEHCMYAVDIAPAGLQMAALLHDASEAYLLDIPRPVKVKLTNYKDVENRLMEVIAAKFGFEWPLHPEVKKIDEKLLRWEWDSLMLDKRKMYKKIRTPEEAKVDFLDYFKQIKLFDTPSND